MGAMIVKARKQESQKTRKPEGRLSGCPAFRLSGLALIYGLTTLLFPCSVAHTDIGLSGSAYNETSFINSDGTIRYGNRSDLHLKAVSLSQGAKLVAELDFYMLYGYLSTLPIEILPAMIGDLSRAAAAQLYKDGLFYVDRLYLKFPVSRADVILGKQRIAWGSGVVFSPTDNFNRPNPLSLSGRKEGINALVTKLFLGDLSALDFIIAPADVFKRVDGEINLERLRYSKFASRLTFNKFKTDMALSYQYDGEPENHIFGLDIKGDLELGYHLETVFIYNRDGFHIEEMEEYWQSVLGLDYSFQAFGKGLSENSAQAFFQKACQGEWILLGEYFYNGAGMEREEALPATDFLLLEEFGYRHYLYSQISYQRDILLGANIFLLWNMVDRSFILSPGVRYSLFQNTDLDIYSQMFFGDEADEYGPARLGGDQLYYLKLTVKF